jgi:hypothetical protein
MNPKDHLSSHQSCNLNTKDHSLRSMKLSDLMTIKVFLSKGQGLMMIWQAAMHKRTILGFHKESTMEMKTQVRFHMQLKLRKHFLKK